MPFWFQKGTKNWEIFWKIFFSQNVDFQLSKDIPIMFQTFLEQILGSNVVRSKMAKNVIFAIFRKIHPPTSEYKFPTKHHRNILRPDLESLGSILSISNFIFIFWCLFVTQTVFSVQNLSFSRSQVMYSFGYKKAWKT